MYKLVVLSSVLAIAASSAIAPLGLGLGVHGLGVHGLGWGGLAAPLAAPWAGAAIAAPWAGAHVAVAHVAAPVAVAPSLHAYNYRGPLSLGPGQPANIVAADGRPLDTLSVNLDRAAHLTARVVDAGAHGGHWLKKRSAPLWGPATAWSHSARIDLPTAHWGAPALAAPLGLGIHAGVAPIAPLGLGHAGVWGHGAGLGHLW